MKLNQFADVLVVKKPEMSITKQFLWGRIYKKNLIKLNWLEIFKKLFSLFSYEPTSTKSIKYKHVDATAKTKWTNKRDYNQL